MIRTPARSLCLSFAILLLGSAVPLARTAARPAQKPVAPAEMVDGKQPQFTPRIRPMCPVRLGGVYLQDLGKANVEETGSAAHAGKLSAENRTWIAAHCDVIALDAATITPDTFPALTRAHRLFTPLLFVYASSLYEQPGHKGSVSGWKPADSAWTLRDTRGRELFHPDLGGHWMDFGNTQWADYWQRQALGLVKRYGAYGVVAAELPVGNTFVQGSLAKYHTAADRMAATVAWLRTVRAGSRFLFIPSGVGFDALTGHTTLPTPPGTEEESLRGRLWDDYFGLMDGAWAEGWVHPYWSDGSMPEKSWEIELEAADRAGRNAQVFIATCAYHDASELEFDLASYLLVVHHQGRLVFQPMPLTDLTHPDSGFSLATLRREFASWTSYFDVPLGVGIQERHPISAEGGVVWRRAFENGVVYVNSNDRKTVSVALGGPMQRLDGSQVRRVELPPHSGAILLYPKK